MKLISRIRYFRKYIRFRDMPITIKLCIYFSFFFLFMIVLSEINFLYYKADKKNVAFDTLSQYNNQAVNMIDEYFTDLNSITKYPLFVRTNGVEFINSLSAFNESGIKSYDFIKESELIFTELRNYKPYIQSIFIFNTAGDSVSGFFSESTFHDYNPSNEDWFKQSITNIGKPVVVNTFEIPSINPSLTDPIKKSNYIFSLARGIVSLPSREVVGIILVNTNINFLDKIAQKMMIYPSQRIVIIDNNGNIMYDTTNKNITKKMDGPLFDAVRNSESGVNTIEIENSNSLISYATSNNSEWKIINVIKEDELNKGINIMEQTTLLITALMFMAAIFLIFLFFRQIVRPIRKLMQLMRFVEEGNFDVKIKLESKDEIGILAGAFNSMSMKINNLINEVYVSELKQKDLELQSLQAQINPHFLYNSLDAINMMAEINNDSETSKMAISLGKILRYGISNRNNIVTVREEIDCLKDYIMLQEIRFSDIYKISLDIDEGMLDCHTTKLILQPLVENAVIHGLYKSNTDGRIDILGYRSENHIIFEVIDDGIGMDEEQTLKLNEYVNDLNHSLHSIGLKNVHKRIQLQYGDDYGIEITSELGKGTRVKVRFPNVEGSMLL